MTTGHLGTSPFPWGQRTICHRLQDKLSRRVSLNSESNRGSSILVDKFIDRLKRLKQANQSAFQVFVELQGMLCDRAVLLSRELPFFFKIDRVNAEPSVISRRRDRDDIRKLVIPDYDV